MVANQQRKLLENLPSKELDRHRLDDYKALKEDLKENLGIFYLVLVQLKICNYKNSRSGDNFSIQI